MAPAPRGEICYGDRAVRSLHARARQIVTPPTRRTLRREQLARIYDSEIAPCWGARFGALLLRNLVVPARSQVLDVACGTGYATLELLDRMTPGSRLIAIDGSSAMLDALRRKVAGLGPLDGKAVFLRTQSALPRLAFADEVYDLVVCNLGVAEMPSLEAAICDFARVTRPGGEVRCTLPLAGTFEEVHDLYREVLAKHDKHDALDRLGHHVARYPRFDQLERCLAAADLTGRVELEEFSLLFRSARELFFAPVIEYGPLADWKAVAGDGQEMQDVFWYIKEAIDAYFGDRPFHVTVKAACVIGRKAERTQPVAVALGGTTVREEASARIGDDDRTHDLGIEQLGTGDISFESLESLESLETIESVASADSFESLETAGLREAANDARAELTLDAFIAGKPRPRHLVG
jgi:ubiquinone/menaquinone biosynthesis C-methylase UbiE